MDLNNLSDEVKAKALECKTAEELLALAADEGVELSDDQLQAISGGMDWSCAFRDCSNNKGW